MSDSRQGPRSRDVAGPSSLCKIKSNSTGTEDSIKSAKMTFDARTCYLKQLKA